MKKIKQNLLLHWIVTCTFIFLIPFVSIVINYAISSRTINTQVKNSHHTLLSTVSSSVDKRLQSMRHLSWLLLLSDDFSQFHGQDDFLNSAQACYKTLYNYHYVHDELEILSYFPFHNFIISSSTANYASSAYYTLSFFAQEEMLPYEEWLSIMQDDYTKAHFFFSPYCSYDNYGKNNIVYACANPYATAREAAHNIMVITTTDFIDAQLTEFPDTTLLILTKDGELINQFGNTNIFESTFHVDLDSDIDITYLTQDSMGYFCSYVLSEENEWVYMLCTPKFLYLQDTRFIRNVTILSAMGSLILGIMLIILTQRKNYKPLRQIIDTIPASMKASSFNEFEQLQLYQSELNKNYSLLLKKLNFLTINAKELYLYSKLKGSSVHMDHNNILENIWTDFSGKHFAIISIYADNQQISPTDILKNADLLRFSIQNVADEIIPSCFEHEYIQDEFLNVFFFVLTEEQLEQWNVESMDYFHKLHAFFQEHFQLNLYITVGKTYTNFEQTYNHYNKILTSFEYYYSKKKSGVSLALSCKENISGMVNYIKNHASKINLAILQKDAESIPLLVDSFLQNLQDYNLPDIINHYYIHSLMTLIIMDIDYYANDATRDYVEKFLNKMLQYEASDKLKRKLTCLLLCLCTEKASSEPETQEECQLVKRIKTYVDDYYTDCNMNIASLADVVNLSPKYLSKVFRDNTNESLLDYINQVRINHAKELLRTTNININDLALAVGFSNSRSFRRNFTKTTGVTPTDYRTLT